MSDPTSAAMADAAVADYLEAGPASQRDELLQELKRAIKRAKRPPLAPEAYAYAAAQAALHDALRSAVGAGMHPKDAAIRYGVSEATAYRMAKQPPPRGKEIA